MSWDVEILTMVRHMINDVDETSYKYTDERLKIAILIAAQLTQGQISFVQSYEIDVDAFILTPDPTDRGANTRDDAFINLVSMKCACVLLNGEAKTSAGQALDIRDGSSYVGLKGIAKSKLEIAQYFCEGYEKAKIEYLVGSVCPGEAIVTPFKIFSNDIDYINNSRYY